MKSFIKSFLGTLYLSILLFFVSWFSCQYWFFIIPFTATEFDIYAKYFYIILPLLPFVIVGVKTLYCFLRKRKDNLIASSKTFKIFKLIFLIPIILLFILLIQMSIQASHTHDPGMGLGIEMIFMSFTVYVIPFYWIFILHTLKKTYGIKWGWGGLLIAFVSFYLFFNFSVRCPLDKPLKDVSGRCHSCDEKRPITTVNNCSTCPNRVKISNGSCGIIANCPADKPLKGENGECYSCDDPQGIFVLDCSVCSNRTIIRGHCSLTKCPPDKPMREEFGDCYSCDRLEYIPFIDKEQCDLCLNRKMIKHTNNGCALSSCPKDYPLQDLDGSCYSCDDPKAITLLSKNCSICSNRSLIDERCSWTTCPKNYPVRAPYGKCMSCEESSHYAPHLRKGYEEYCRKI